MCCMCTILLGLMMCFVIMLGLGLEIFSIVFSVGVRVRDMF